MSQDSTTSNVDNHSEITDNFLPNIFNQILNTSEVTQRNITDVKINEYSAKLSKQSKEIERIFNPSKPKPLRREVKQLGIRLHLLATNSKQDARRINCQTFNFKNVIKGINIASDINNYNNYSENERQLIQKLAEQIIERMV